jgi:hypothetical protein
MEGVLEDQIRKGIEVVPQRLLRCHPSTPPATLAVRVTVTMHKALLGSRRAPSTASAASDSRPLQPNC